LRVTAPPLTTAPPAPTLPPPVTMSLPSPVVVTAALVAPLIMSLVRVMNTLPVEERLTLPAAPSAWKPKTGSPVKPTLTSPVLLTNTSPATVWAAMAPTEVLIGEALRPMPARAVIETVAPLTFTGAPLLRMALLAERTTLPSPALAAPPRLRLPVLFPWLPALRVMTLEAELLLIVRLGVVRSVPALKVMLAPAVNSVLVCVLKLMVVPVLRVWKATVWPACCGRVREPLPPKSLKSISVWAVMLMSVGPRLVRAPKDRDWGVLAKSLAVMVPLLLRKTLSSIWLPAVPGTMLIVVAGARRSSRASSRGKARSQRERGRPARARAAGRGVGWASRRSQASSDMTGFPR
jgi:hypothetical protein